MLVAQKVRPEAAAVTRARGPRNRLESATRLLAADSLEGQNALRSALLAKLRASFTYVFTAPVNVSKTVSV